MYFLLSRTQAGPGRTVKQEQEEISRNHEQTFIYLSVLCSTLILTSHEHISLYRVHPQFLKWSLSLLRNAPPSSEDYNPPSSPSLASSDEDADNTADSATAAQELIASFTADG